MGTYVGITVTIKYNFKLNDNSSNNQAIDQRNPKEIEILNAIENDTVITVSELAKTFGYTVDSVQHYVNKLKKDGIIIHTGSTKGGTWKILEEN